MNWAISPIKRAALVAGIVAGIGVLGAGCLTRPVATGDPHESSTITFPVTNDVIDKLDLLFDIDNSASMGDKQDYLKLAIPSLIDRLINPNCVDAMTGTKVVGASTNGACPANAKLEFPPVHDMHVGILSSSLGNRLGGGIVCLPTAAASAPFDNVLANNDDRGHLLNRSLAYTAGNASVTQSTVADAAPSPQDQFLDWFPMVRANAGKSGAPGTPVTDPTTLIDDFKNLVGGVGVFGCGIESQLESWYRFLIQPDPYESLALTNGGAPAQWQGVDQTILQQRHDFLRPDSLVAIVVLSDENDSEIDVRSLGGQGYNWMSEGFPPPRGTSACGTGLPSDPPDAPASAGCMSCAQPAASGDPNCAPGKSTYPTSAWNDWGYDLNLRHVHMKAKYGVDPQYPIQRYVHGLTSPTVPDRHGEYPDGASVYQGVNDCTNPLFAAALPDGSKLDVTSLCKLAPGSRDKALVFYAHIGGVPYQLLHFQPEDPAASQLSDADWVKILGKDPLHYDYTGIDEHMVESYQPRPGLTAPGSANNADPIHGHEWITDQGAAHILKVDREYACTFPLVDVNGNPSPRDCTQPANASFCDCPVTTNGGPLTPEQLPPICNTTTQTLQTGAKAYPTTRELLLAKLMGPQGVVSSICPQHVTPAQGKTTATDLLFGYNPAVAVIIDKLKVELNNRCLPQPLTRDDKTGVVPCLVLVTMPPNGGTCLNPVCPSTAGLVGPGGTIAPGQTFDPAVLQQYCADQETGYAKQLQAAAGDTTGLVDPATRSVCALRQLTPQNEPADFQAGSCADAKVDSGWCYVTGSTGTNCSFAVIFTQGQPPDGSVANLQCLEQAPSVIDGG
jgi:hypothetical protein